MWASEGHHPTSLFLQCSHREYNNPHLSLLATIKIHLTHSSKTHHKTPIPAICYLPSLGASPLPLPSFCVPRPTPGEEVHTGIRPSPTRGRAPRARYLCSDTTCKRPWNKHSFSEHTLTCSLDGLVHRSFAGSAHLNLQLLLPWILPGYAATPEVGTVLLLPRDLALDSAWHHLATQGPKPTW